MKTSKACVVTSRNSLWKQWNTMCQHVAHRLSTHIPGWPPWMLRRLSNRKHKVHTRAKHSNDTKEKKRFKALKGQLQRESRRTHRTYLEDIVCDDLRTNPKRFLSYMKTRKQDSSQIVTLRSKTDSSTATLPAKPPSWMNSFSHCTLKRTSAHCLT